MNRWFLGLVCGLVTGLGVLETGTIGMALGAGMVVLLALLPERRQAVGGFAIGFGGMWLALLGRLGLFCSVDCQPGDLSPWLAIAGVAIGLGLILTVIGSRRRTPDL